MTSHTDNFNLPLYDTGDPANLRDQYNNAMGVVDKELKKTADGVTAATGRANDAVGRLNSLGITDDKTAVASQKRWDGAASLATANKGGIDAIDANLNALHANSVTNASNLYDMIITSGGRGGHMVIIGDSITAGFGLTTPQTQAYPRFLSDALGLTAHVYAQSGAGFVARSAAAPYSTLGDLCSRAANDGSYDHDMVHIVLVMGGINDGYDEALAARSNAIAGLNILHGAFPKAQVYFGVCPTCGLSRQANKTVYSGVPAIADNVLNLKTVNKSMDWVCHIIDAWALLWPDLSLTTDGLHPNEDGHKYLAGAILSAMSGQSDTMTPPAAPLWGRGSVRNIMTANQIPDVDRYSWIKTHFRSSRQTWPNLISRDGRSWTYKSSYSINISYNSDGTQQNVIYFPISILPDCLKFYRKDSDWSKLNYDPVFQFYSFSQDITLSTGTAQFLCIVQYNMKHNTIEVAISGSKKPVSENVDITLATPTFTIPIPLMIQ